MCYIDTGILYIKTNDIYKHIADVAETIFDISVINYMDHFLKKQINKLTRLMNDKLVRNRITTFLALKAKNYI